MRMKNTKQLTEALQIFSNACARHNPVISGKNGSPSYNLSVLYCFFKSVTLQILNCIFKYIKLYCISVIPSYILSILFMDFIFKLLILYKRKLLGINIGYFSTINRNIVKKSRCYAYQYHPQVSSIFTIF